MAYNRTQARNLLSAAELELFESSLDVEPLTAARLRSKIKRTRGLRDKFRDLLQRQKLRTRSRTGIKGGASGTANLRTEQKARLFAEVLARFEKRLAQLDAAEARAAKRAAAAKARLLVEKKRGTQLRQTAARRPNLSAKAPANPPASGKPRLSPTRESARATRHAMQMKASGRQAINAHVRARGRRAQAKRDSRG